MITLEHKTPGHPLYWQIYEQIKRDIHGGVLAAEEKRPPSASWRPPSG